MQPQTLEVIIHQTETNREEEAQEDVELSYLPSTPVTSPSSDGGTIATFTPSIKVEYRPWYKSCFHYLWKRLPGFNCLGFTAFCVALLVVILLLIARFNKFEGKVNRLKNKFDDETDELKKNFEEQNKELQQQWNLTTEAMEERMNNLTQEMAVYEELLINLTVSTSVNVSVSSPELDYISQLNDTLNELTQSVNDLNQELEEIHEQLNATRTRITNFLNNVTGSWPDSIVCDGESYYRQLCPYGLDALCRYAYSDVDTGEKEMVYSYRNGSFVEFNGNNDTFISECEGLSIEDVMRETTFVRRFSWRY